MKKLRISKKQQEDDKKQLKDYTVTFYRKKSSFEKTQKQFELVKKAFYDYAEKYCRKYDVEEVILNPDDKLVFRALKLKRVQSVKVKFDTVKLRKKLDKETFNDVSETVYKINDMQGLVSYLKECDVDPNIFKSFIDVETKINQKKLDNLYDLGEVTEEDIEGCYELQTGNLYFKISEVEQ